MTLPIISGYTAAFLGVLQIFLMMNVGITRQKSGISLGDGGNEALLYKIRRHGNLTENAPLFLILLGFLEIAGSRPPYLLGLVAIFVVARLSHAYALSGPGKSNAARGIGAMGTVAGILGAAFLLAWQLSMTQ